MVWKLHIGPQGGEGGWSVGGTPVSVNLKDYGIGDSGVRLEQLAELPAFQAYPELRKVVVKPMPAGKRTLGDMMQNEDGTYVHDEKARKWASVQLFKRDAHDAEQRRLRDAHARA